MNRICIPPSPLASDNEGEDRRVMNNIKMGMSYKLAPAGV